VTELRRRAELRLSAELLEGILESKKLIPDDAKIGGAKFNPFTATVSLLFESEKAHKVPELANGPWWEDHAFTGFGGE